MDLNTIAANYRLDGWLNPYTVIVYSRRMISCLVVVLKVLRPHVGLSDRLRQVQRYEFAENLFPVGETRDKQCLRNRSGVRMLHR